MNAPITFCREVPHVTCISLNRPEKRNAMNIELLEELCRVVEETQALPDQRIILLRGEGPVFCAGLDLKEALTHDKAETSAQHVAKMLRTLYQCPLVTIALIHGAAMAGGAGMMSTCDFVIAAEGTQIGYPETRRGLVAGLVMTFLRRQLRERHIRELLLLGKIIDAQEAQNIGLINRVVPEEKLFEEAKHFTEAILKGAPGANRRTKEMLSELWHSPVSTDLELALSYHMKARCSSEAEEGIQAFFEKRAPQWQ